MKTVFESIPESVVSALGWTLLHSVWQGTLLAALAFAGFFLLRKSAASLRYNAGIAFLSLQVIISVVTFSYYQQKTTLVSVIPHNSLVTKTLTETVTTQASNYNLPLTAKVQIWLNMHIHELVICWLIGACLLMLRFAGGWIYTEHLRSKARLVIDKEWRVRFGMLAAKLNISRSVEFRETARILTPMVIGTLRPAVLIPLGFLTGFSTSQIEAILAHELAHIRRNDYLVNMLQSLIEVIFFFHPALWWLSEKIRTEREHCCDDIALTVCEDKMALARALVKVAEWQSAPYLAMAFASKKPLLLQRITRVMGVAPKSGKLRANWPLTMVFISLLVGFSMFAVGQRTKVSEKKTNGWQLDKVQSSNEISATEELSQDVSQIEVYNEDPVIDAHISKVLSESNTDTLDKKREEFQQKMDALQTEMEPLQRRMDELNLLTEKENFEKERYERELEKIEWKKERLMESRSKLIDKRSSLLNPSSKGGQSKLSESELEKQLEEFEKQIKAQEQQITDFNQQIASVRKESVSYEESEPVKSTKWEIDEISRKIDELGAKMGLMSFELIDYTPVPPVPPRAPKAPKTAKVKGAGSIAAPPAPPAKPKTPAVPPAPPVRK